MRNIWRIIKADARSLFTHFFALAVALVIAVLPSLYAWLNIYSNWDPYGNTGNISIAVASLDKGWTEEDGTQVNKGREVVDDLRGGGHQGGGRARRLCRGLLRLRGHR